MHVLLFLLQSCHELTQHLFLIFGNNTDQFIG